MWDAILIFFVCIGYAFCSRIPDPRIAVWILYSCLVGDQLLFGTGMARDIYLSRIAKKPEDVSPSLSMGVSINHIVSMSIPTVCGIMWESYGYSSVFVGAAAVALIMLFFTSMIKVPQTVAGG